MQSGTWSGTKQTLIFLLLTGLLAPAGYAQKRAQPKPAAGSAATKQTPPPPGEKVVLRVGTDQVTEADFNYLVENLGPQFKQAIATQGRRPIGEQYAMMLLLAQQAVSHKFDSSPEFRRKMAMQRIQWLAEAEVKQLESQVKLAPEEVSQYYSAHPSEFEEAQVQQIVVRKKTEGTAPGTPGLSPQEAKTRAESIRAALTAGKDIKAVAQEFQNANEVLVGTEPRTLRRGQLPAEMDRALFQVKDGELTEPLDAGQAVIVFRMVGRRSPELKEVTQEVENILRQQRVQAMLADMRQKASIWMDEAFFATPPGSPPVPAAGTPADNPPPQP